jgi:hypothetical protein
VAAWAVWLARAALVARAAACPGERAACARGKDRNSENQRVTAKSVQTCPRKSR